MEEEYLVFDDRHNKILDLVQMVDDELAKKYKKLISFVPDSVKKKLGSKEELCIFGKNFRVDLQDVDDMLEFQMERYGKYFCANVQIYPFCDFELEDGVKFDEEEFDDDDEEVEIEDRHLFVFSLTLSDTEGEPEIRFNYEEKDGKYIYKDTQMNGLELDYEVFIDKVGTDYFLTCVKQVNGIDVYVKKLPIEYDTLLEYADTAEEANEDDIDF